jgi:HJR/Mrr/RecB family endonuclease
VTFFIGDGRHSEFSLALGGGGAAVLVTNVLRTHIARSLARRRYEKWVLSPEGYRCNEIGKHLEAAREAFAQAEAAARTAAEERQRQELARQAQDRDYLLKLSPREFERHVATIFSAVGYQVELTPASNDEGVDVYLNRQGRVSIVQCKHLAAGTPVSRPMLQQFFGVLQHKQAHEGFFITTGRFTEGAVEFVQNYRIHLIDLEKLVEMARGAFTEDFIRSGPAGRITAYPRRSRRWRRGWRR